MTLDDIPSPIDLRSMQHAKEWAESAMLKRPWRTEFFEQFARQIELAPSQVHNILELGSGPGFLAEHLLRRLPGVSYSALDFSAAMHALAKDRLAEAASRVQFIQRSFLDSDWSDALGFFDCIVTNQAVHELRHKRHASALHAQARKILAPAGLYLVCDHFYGEDGMQNDQLYMTVAEQKQALIDAGFGAVEQVLLKGGLALHCAH